MTRALLLGTLLLACAPEDGSAGAAAGEACGRTADCVSGLRCSASLCVEAEVGPAADCQSFAPKALDRLNRAEYDNSIRDLFGMDLHPAQGFPADDHSHGFDHIVDALAVSPLLVEKWEAAARTVVEEALRPPLEEPLRARFEAEDVGAEVGILRKGSTWKLTDVGGIVVDVEIPTRGRYKLSVRAFQIPAGSTPAKLAMRLDEEDLAVFEVHEEEGAPRTFEMEWGSERGPVTLAAVFVNAFKDPGARDSRRRERALVIDWVEVEGPLGRIGDAAAGDVASLGLSGCDGSGECGRDLVGRLARRAWRRPLRDGELDELMAIREQALSLGASADEALSWTLRAVLMDPAFLFRVEAPAQESVAGSQPLDPHALAARLAAFLWSSTPDEALLEAADAGSIDVEAEVDRMLLDRRSEALIHNFAGQWLFIRALDRIDPDYGLYPDFDEALRASMRAEAEAVFRAFLHEDRNALDMLDADFTFADAKLAAHYGLPDPPSPAEGLVRMDVGGTVRQGLLTQAAMLSVTSHRTRTSPIKRGWWVLKQLLCDEPAPPPPGIPTLSDDDPAGLRDRMERHRADPACAGCHVRMDPIGLALEVFDPIGAWRSQDRDGAVDARSELPGGIVVDGPLGLAAVLKADPEVASCLVRQVFTYALGRGPRADDACALAAVEADWRRRGQSLGDLVRAVATSQPFIHRAAAP